MTIVILASGTLFGLLHFGNHPGDVFLMLPYSIAVSAVYGGLTWAADSVLPALVLHSMGDTSYSCDGGSPAGLSGRTQPALVWDGGIDVSFILAAITFIALTVLTILAYGMVRRQRVTMRLSPLSVAAPTTV